MSDVSGISAREAEVLGLVGAGRSNAEIADRLFISVRTVESHVSSLLRKCAVTGRRDLAGVAARLMPPPAIAALPAPRTGFVGRVAECDAVLAALADARLVTLVGTGGVGKTRLAVEVAAGFPSGGAFVDLVPVRDGFVAQAVAAVLDVTPGQRQSLIDAVVQRLGDAPALLVVDNCEHVLDAVASLLERVMSGCPGVTVLATSRERLGLPGERVRPVPPLPDPDGRVLFRDRAGAVDPDFVADPALIGELCARLDGVPLAIELAAARSASLGPAGLRAALADPLRLASGGRGADRRHRSLRTVLGWSYGLLDAPEQALFRRLAVFAGGFDVDMAVSVAACGDEAETADLIGRLVDKSLVVHQRDIGRWRLLGTVRAFGRELLEADGARIELFDRYLGWARSVAVTLAGRLADGWRADFDAVADDLRAALLNAPPGPGETAHQLARALGKLAFARRFLADSLRYYQHAAERAPDPAEAGRDLWSAAHCAMTGIEPGPRVVDLLLAAAERAGGGPIRARALARVVELVNRFDGRLASDLSPARLGHLLDEARAAADPADSVSAAAIAVAAAWNGTGRRYEPDPRLAGPAAAAASATGDPVLVSAGLDILSTVAATTGGVAEAGRLSGERLALLPVLDRNSPEAGPEIKDIFAMAVTTALRAGDVSAALDVARRMADDDLLGNRSAYSLATLVPALLLAGELEETLGHADELWHGWRRSGGPPTGEVLTAAAFAMLGGGLLGDRERLRLWRGRFGEIEAGAAVETTRLASVVFAEARVAVQLGDTSLAAELVERSAGEFLAFRFDSYARAAGAELAVLAGFRDAAERISATAGATAGNAWAAACLARASGRLHGDADELAAAAAGWERIGARFELAATLALLR